MSGGQRPVRMLMLIAASVAPAPETGAAASAGDQAEPGTVFVLERLGRDDAAVFLFDPSVPRERAEEQIEEAALAVGLANRGIAERDSDERARQLEMRTTVGTDAGFFRRAISGEVLDALAGPGGPGPVVLELPSGAELVRGDLAPLDRRGRFAVRGEGPVVYRIPPAHVMWRLAALAAILTLPFPALRRYARRLQRVPVHPAVKVRRLRRARMGTLAGILALGLALLVAGGIVTLPETLLSEAVPAVTRWPGFRILAPVALVAVVLLGALGSVSLALRPAARVARS